MACDIFSSDRARQLLNGKCIYFFGGSNMRALYKDLLWLLESGTLIPQNALKTKNEKFFANDVRISNGTLHGGRHYVEVREYKENPFIKFQFITRLLSQEFIDTIMNVRHSPEFIVINSCLWDVSRWGVDGVEQFKINLISTFDFLRTRLPKTSRIIWLTAFPPSFQSKGGLLTKEIEFLRGMLPWHMIFANKYAADLANRYEIDIIDIHYHFRFLLDYHTKDGIHWAPVAMRYATNMLLTHIALVSEAKLPGVLTLDKEFLWNSQKITNPNNTTNFGLGFRRNDQTVTQERNNCNKRKRRDWKNYWTGNKRGYRRYYT